MVDVLQLSTEDGTYAPFADLTRASSTFQPEQMMD